MKTLKLTTLGLLVLAATSAAQAGTWSLGASALVSPDPYRGNNDRVYPVPIINYEGDDFYFRSLTAGYYLWKDEQNQLSVMAFYNPLHFKASDSDDRHMKQLSNRHSTVMAGVAYTHKEDWGSIRTSFAGDILDNSNGLIADAAYLFPITAGDWSFTPGAGVTWNSSNQNDYYFGVSGSESNRSGYKRYTASDSWNPYVELTARYQINSNWNAFFTGRYIRLSDEVKDSPMIDKSYTGLLWTGVTYTF
ncbi:MipA/OmpV family protein [Obesumbacterium proteus]|uniref:Outer membrane protein V n=1 Tax=Obesumbacterium proteus ATCC 12841 TaxID=1354268 RepID=A0AA91EHP2_9GAMM|nr:MipA/OmpV family protein [Obesumbacterium proteus]AMO81351.1 MltA-interacting protein MipA [Obesumbacterium proteus]KKI47741.1 MltA-interacting protein MipA [Obesumbacterium proteus]MDN6072067.1 MipA/OmpV family protein [Enterobacterales bacterium]OAT60989.1 outer membrane protein V [Obesumbacterium proteus ATCC 12841]